MQGMDLTQYKTLVLDCDGVVLNSNKTKVNAYFEVAKRHGGSDEQAQALVNHHVQKGSFPRNGKIEYYLKEIRKQEITPELMQAYMHTFAEILDKTLMECEIAPGLHALRKATQHSKWMLLSGGNQHELRTIFARRDLAPLFDAGIFGGPDTKDIVLTREIGNGNLQLPAIFIGDSKYDFEAATRAGLDFVFLSEWTEVADWQTFCSNNHIRVTRNLREL
ncbi:MAG: HAD family hydrolase [Betaproteobacteria bacterium]|nr:HAD family hydrolase [Betaproteobacteria bacterium]